MARKLFLLTFSYSDGYNFTDCPQAVYNTREDAEKASQRHAIHNDNPELDYMIEEIELRGNNA